jgi:hypothetical protein
MFIFAQNITYDSPPLGLWHVWNVARFILAIGLYISLLEPSQDVFRDTLYSNPQTHLEWQNYFSDNI